MTRLQHILLTYLHQPYIWGGDDPILGFDCSGFVQEVLKIFGADPLGDQTADGLYRYCKENGFRQAASPGVLAFYGSEAKITHVAICFDADLVIEAGGGGSKTLTVADAAKQNAYLRLRPRNHRKDLVALFWPPGLPTD